MRLLWVSVLTIASLSAADRAMGAEVYLEADRRGFVAPDFGLWMTHNRPDMPEARWDYRHMLYMQEHFDRVTVGEILRLMLQVSGRHGKTEHMKGYAAYLLQRDPSTRILFCTYNQKQANKISKQIQRLVTTLGMGVGSGGVEEWEIDGGGGLRAVGAGAGVASVNADVILIDDPIGSRAEAESPAEREAVWDWMTTDILARCEPHTRVIFSMPRWHQDDPAGRIQDRQGGRWTIVDLPGVALDGDQLGRAEGELLCPELRGEEWHEGMRAELLAYGYASFIQCRPTPREGGRFKWEWWGLIDEVPAVGRMIRYWDLAGTDVKARGHDPDWTAGALLCRMADLRTAIVDVDRFRKSVAARDTRLEEVARSDLEFFGQRVSWWIEKEAGIEGERRTTRLVRRLQGCGMNVRTEHPTGKKELRWEPLEGAAESGNVVLCPGEWRDPFRAEMAGLPGGAHDDQADATSAGFQKLAARTTGRIRTYRV